MDLLYQLQSIHKHLSNAERRIANIVLRDPDSIIHSTTAALARRAQVSDPTVARFCRHLDCKGFPDFKVLLAQSLARGAPYLSQTVSADDSVEDLINKLIALSQVGLENVRTHLDPIAVEHTITILAEAERIEFYGMGAGGSIAHDAQHKFLRLGKAVVAYEDNLKQRMSAATANVGVAILFLSFTGRTRALLEVAEIARQNRVSVLAITAPNSPLASLCENAITLNTHWEDTTLYTPMASRIAFLAIIDILATGVALAMGDAIQPHLRRAKESLVDTKLIETGKH